MYVILDLHAAPGGQGFDQAISDYNPDLPSLWESQANRDKMVALWGRIAEHYKDEPVIAGYDLLNEPNWNLNQGQELRELYGDVTDAIRAVDQTHILFIEGNWFANDFTGLTPPWDDNLVYSPHKYWSFNDQASIQWVLDMRNEFNVPLYLGESGENSNVWFKDAIALLAEHNIGWAWWPMKKIESVAGPLSVEKTEGWNQLLSFWRGGGPAPSSTEAYDILMDLTEKLKIENCRFQEDVIDAMFRQQNSSETLPFVQNTVPGIVFATDFDLGGSGQAYFDVDDANYQVSTGDFTAWNNGWAYRNDGVDIEICQDDTNTNGFNVAWTETDEWIKYTLNVSTAGVYDLHLRTAATNNLGSISFEVDESRATDPFPVPNTNDFQNWTTLVVPDVILNEGLQEISCHINNGGFNLSSFDFQYSAAMNSVAFKMNQAKTVDQNTIELQLNKSIDPNATLNANEFVLEIDGQVTPISELARVASSERKVLLSVAQDLHGGNQIRISYEGNQLQAIDETELFNFEKAFVVNNLPNLLLIPGQIQAESFATAEGIELEETFDGGQGLNIGFLDPGDYLEYRVVVEQTAPYLVRYRTASEWAAGQIRLSFISDDGSTTVADEATFPITGGWQIWQTTENEIELSAGEYLMRIDILESPFNMNWLEFESLFVAEVPNFGMSVSPNPFTDFVLLEAHYQSPHKVSYELYDVNGRLLLNKSLDWNTDLVEEIPLRSLNSGLYFLRVSLENDQVDTYKLYKN